MKIGVLALQGAFREHLSALQDCGAEAFPVRKPEQLEGIQGLVIPGGESTAIGQLMVEYGFDRSIPALAEQGLPIYGTCAGLILLAKEIVGEASLGEAGTAGQYRLALMDIVAHRNAYGRQRESFEADIDIAALGPEPFRGVFIRAPYIVSVQPGVEILARQEGKIVMARQGQYLATSFHPELTGDRRVHRYFLEMAAANAGGPPREFDKKGLAKGGSSRL